MKYIKYFESVSELYWIGIPSGNIIPIDDNLSVIKSFVPNAFFSFRKHLNQIKVTYPFSSLPCSGYFIYISKRDDNYFEVDVYNDDPALGRTPKTYTCDELDGLKSLITDLELGKLTPKRFRSIGPR